jgi:hypothetical protein
MTELELKSATPEPLAAELERLGRVFKARDLVVEISPTRGFRIVREGNTAQGILASRHAMIGLIICLGNTVIAGGPDAFWKEVLS